MNIQATLRALLLAAVAASVPLTRGAAAEATGFRKKDCLDCHKKEAAAYQKLEYAHTAVKKGKCEDCHLRHGIVAKLLLKEPGNALCTKCHKRETLGLDKPNVHSVLRRGFCRDCHAAHRSNAPQPLYSACGRWCGLSAAIAWRAGSITLSGKLLTYASPILID